MMYKEPKPMQEIHKIRLTLGEEHKNLTSEEHVAKVNREAEEIIEKYGLCFKKSAHTH
jgi:hypothetical protein